MTTLDFTIFCLTVIAVVAIVFGNWDVARSAVAAIPEMIKTIFGQKKDDDSGEDDEIQPRLKEEIRPQPSRRNKRKR